MESFFNRPILPYVSVIVLWVASCYVQSHLTSLNFVAGVSLLYIPAGIRTLTVFVLGFRGAVAVFCGSLVTILFEFPYLQPTPIEVLWAIAVGAVSAFSAYVAMKAVKYWKKIPPTLEGLSMRDVVYIVISQGLVSSTLHQLLFQTKGAAEEYVNDTTEQAIVYWAAMASGDILGSMLVLLSVLIAYQMFTKQQ